MASAKIEFGLTSTGKASITGQVEAEHTDDITTITNAVQNAIKAYEQSVEFSLKEYGRLNKEIRGN